MDESEKMRNELFESSKTLINVKFNLFLFLINYKNIKRDNNDLVEKLQNLNENYLNLEKKKKKVELDKILLENQMIGLGLFPYRFQSGEKTQTNTLNSISNYHNNDTSFQQVNLEFDYAKKEKTSQKNVINKTPEKFPQKKKNFSPQTLLNNLINNQKKERNTITDCLKLKIEIARGSNDLNSKNVNMASSLNKQRIQSFPVNNKSVEENLFHNKKPTEKKENNNQQNKPNFHNTSLGLNQSSHDLDRGIIKTRSKSSHSKNNYSFNSVSKKQNEYNNRNKKDNISHFPQKEKSDFKEFSINFLKLKNSFCNK